MKVLWKVFYSQKGNRVCTLSTAMPYISLHTLTLPVLLWIKYSTRMKLFNNRQCFVSSFSPKIFKLGQCYHIWLNLEGLFLQSLALAGSWLDYPENLFFFHSFSHLLSQFPGANLSKYCSNFATYGLRVKTALYTYTFDDKTG